MRRRDGGHWEPAAPRRLDSNAHGRIVVNLSNSVRYTTRAQALLASREVALSRHRRRRHRLAIIRELVEADVGQVEVESVVGQGSLFHVRLAASSARRAALSAPAAERSALTRLELHSFDTSPR